MRWNLRRFPIHQNLFFIQKYNNLHLNHNIEKQVYPFMNDNRDCTRKQGFTKSRILKTELNLNQFIKCYFIHNILNLHCLRKSYCTYIYTAVECIYVYFTSLEKIKIKTERKYINRFGQVIEDSQTTRQSKIRV